MKYVKCVYDGVSGGGIRLTIGKIYEVLVFQEAEVEEHKYSPIIEIEDNIGDIASYSMYNDTHQWCIDATSEVREQKINSILK